MMNRRRFLCLSAAFAGAPGLAHAAGWTGRALGADAQVSLYGPPDITQRALRMIPRRLDQIEALFSLYRTDSALTELNRTGRMASPDPLMLDILASADTAHDLTGGLFDPTVQPLWRALALGKDVERARAAIGWSRVSIAPAVVLDPGQSLTLNGIAQGFASDVIRADLARLGFTHALVNIGEHAAIGGPFRLTLADTQYGAVGQRTLHGNAIATSSPDAMRLGRHSHILSPGGQAPLWSTVSIEAPDATMADALSTAAVFMPRDELVTLKARAGLHRITLVDAQGNLETV